MSQGFPELRRGSPESREPPAPTAHGGAAQSPSWSLGGSRAPPPAPRARSLALGDAARGTGAALSARPARLWGALYRAAAPRRHRLEVCGPKPGSNAPRVLPGFEVGTFPLGSEIFMYLLCGHTVAPLPPQVLAGFGVQGACCLGSTCGSRAL